MLLLSYLVGLITHANGWWGVVLVVLIAVGIPLVFAVRRKKPGDAQEP